MKRFLSIITALALCLSLCPTWAFAAEGGSEPADLVVDVGALDGVQKIEINGNAVSMDGGEAQTFSALVLTGKAENLLIEISHSDQVTLRDLNITCSDIDMYSTLLDLHEGSSVRVEGTVALASSGYVIVGDNNSRITGPGSLMITYSGTEETAVLLAKGISIGGDLSISAPDGYSAVALSGYVCPITAQNITLTHGQDGSGTLNLNAVDTLTINGQAIAAKVTPADETRSFFSYLTAEALDNAFAADSGNTGATITLLADVERTEPLQIRITCVLDLGGHTICCEQECLTVHYDDTGAPLNVTIRGEGKVISTNNTALTVWGNVTLKGGTFTSNGGDFGGVYVNNPKAELSVTGESVIIQNTGGGYGLAVNEAQSVQLSAGTYFGGKGSIVILNSFTLGNLLPMFQCAYFDENGAPIIGKLGDHALTGTVTVKECNHTGDGVCEYTPNEGAETHAMTCRACGLEGAAESCAYSDDYGHDETNHWQTCTLCGGKKTEAHNWVHQCTSATGIIRRSCDKCEIETVVGTVSVTPDFSVAYGETGSATLACTAELAEGYCLEPEDGEANCWYLTALSGGKSWRLGRDLQVQLPDDLPAGEYRYSASPRLSYQGDIIVGSNISIFGNVTVTPALLTVTGAAAKDRTYDGTNSVQITGVTLDGVLNSDNVSVDLTGLTGTLSGSDAGTYTGVTLPRLTLTGGAAFNYTLPQSMGAVPANVTISKATLTATGATVASKTYNGNVDASVSGVTFL